MKFTDQCLSIVDLNALCSATQDLIGISNLMNGFFYFFISLTFLPHIIHFTLVQRSRPLQITSQLTSFCNGMLIFTGISWPDLNHPPDTVMSAGHFFQVVGVTREVGNE